MTPASDIGSMKTARTIAVFDFDGTLTTRDSFLAFIRYAHGTWRYFAGFALHAPMLILMLMGLYSGSKAKQRIFAHFFKGWQYSRFKSLGQSFYAEIEKIRNEKVINKMREHIAKGHTVYVISASLPEWLEPWCLKQGAKAVIATEIEVDESGLVTGRFKTKNCSGQEKVKRLLEIEPDREEYFLYAYGNSSGDKQLLSFADQSTLVTASKSDKNTNNNTIQKNNLYF